MEAPFAPFKAVVDLESPPDDDSVTVQVLTFADGGTLMHTPGNPRGLYWPPGHAPRTPDAKFYPVSITPELQP